MVRITFFILVFSVSSLVAQSKLDSLSKVLAETPKNTVQYVDVLNTIGYENWIIDTNESIDLGTEALSVAQDISYKPGSADASRVIGVAHWAQGNQVLALKYLNDGLEFYTELNDDEGMGNSFLNIGMVYADLKENDKAIMLYESAITKFTALNLKSRIATTYTKIGILRIEEKKLNDAHKYLTDALKLHTDTNFTYGIAEAHGQLGILFIEQNEIEQAEYHLRRSIVLGRSINDINGLTNNLINFGKILRLENNFDAAEAHIKLGLNKARENELKKHEMSALLELKELKKAEGKLLEAIDYHESFIALKDSVYNSEKSMQIAAMVFKDELQEKQIELEVLKQKKRTDFFVKWALFGGVIGLSLISFYIIYSLKQRAIKNRELTKRKQQLLASKEELARIELENSYLKQQDLEQQLDFKNKELTSYALNFVQKNEFLGQLQDKVTLAINASSKEQLKLLEELKRSIKLSVNIDKDWEDLKRFFEDVHSDFYKILQARHPDLSANDLRICTLTRLNLNIKETASILGISPESAKTARYRLRKKLELQPEDELLNYFLSLQESSS